MRGRLFILYGSQTGTAEDLAVRISYEAKRRLFECEVASLDAFGTDLLQRQRLVLFVVATTGQGDPPDNMHVSWQFLRRRSLAADWLSGLNFGVIGLGDSSYAKFNFVAKRLHRRLLQLGANGLVQSPALGDDQHDLGPDAAVDEWLQNFWLKLDSLHPLPPNAQLESVNYLPKARHVVDVLSGEEEAGDAEEVAILSGSDQFMGRLESNVRVTSDSHFQDVRLIRFSLPNSSDSRCCYTAGDVVSFRPGNLSEDVEEFLSLIGTPAEALVHVREGPISTLVPQPCSVRWLVQFVLDIHSIPRRSFFQLLQHFAVDEMQKEKFGELGSAAGQQDLFDYCNRPRRTLLEVLADFPDTACRVSFEYLLEMVPSIRERSFSIASSPPTCAGSLEILVAVVRYRSKMARERLGLCSNWLARLPVGSSIPMRIKRGTIRFPPQEVPVVMVGPGTGVAPFRSFIQHRVASDSCPGQLPAPRLVLFFGCRNSSGDFFFREEWERLEGEGHLKLFTAFSRDQPEKCYVQHRISEQSALLWQLLNSEGAAIYIAGNARDMPNDVRTAIVQAAQRESGCSQSEAECWVQQLEQNGRFQLETWS